jgi:glycosyltransferase involved in cell wall biosynthesis
MYSVSVVIPTYNYGRFIAEAIQSALAQSYKPAEVIIVDDGSTDETECVVGSFGSEVRYIKQQNAGVCSARNRGVAASTGRLVSFLDADDIWESTKLEKQVALFAADSEIGLVHSAMREFDTATGKTISLHLDGQEGWVADELLIWERTAINGPGGAIMVSRDAFDAVNGFDEQMKVSEDWDFCYRVARKYKVGFVREPLVNYRSHAAAAHLNVREMERGMSLFYAKAFADPDPGIQRLRRRAMGNFYRILAGSYFQSGQYTDFARSSFKSLWNRPASIGYFLKFPLRRVRQA